MAKNNKPGNLKWNSCLVAAGFISLISQLIIFREFLNVFEGNELLIGVLLFTWMIFTAIGSFAGIRLARLRSAEQITGFLFVLAGILPVIAVASLYYLKSVFLPPGASGGLITVSCFASVLLLPVCIVNGMLFSMPSFFSSVISGKNQTAVAYGYDTLGSVIAGIVFTIILSYLLSAMQTLFLVTALTFLFHILIFSEIFYRKLIIGFLAIIVLATGFSGYPDKKLRSMQFPDQQILYSRDTPYGNVCVTGSSGQLNIFQNGILFYSTHNDPVYEESVHFALLQHPDPENVLVVSGGINGALKQVRKYATVRKLDYAEVNPWLIHAETALIPVTDMRILHILNTDAHSHIKQCHRKYDAIILNLPEPVNAQINRYYTFDFFKEAGKALKPGGILETSLGATSNYISEEATAVNASVYQTLKRVFKHVDLIVGQKNYYIASDDRISVSVDSLLAIHQLANDYVNPFYFDDDLTAQRSRMVIENLVSRKTPVNRDIHPVTYAFQIREWLTRSGFYHGAIIFLITLSILTGAIIFLRIKNFRSASFTVFSAAFAGASAEFLLLIIFQILFGQIYRMIGFLFAFYMAGLSAGTYSATRSGTYNMRKSVLRSQIILLVLVLLLPLLILIENPVSGSKIASKPVILLYSFLVAFVSGVLFGKSVMNPSTSPPGSPFRRAESGPPTPLRIAGNFYGIDLVASATGTLLTSILLFPLAGIWITTGFSSVILLASFTINLRAGRFDN